MREREWARVKIKPFPGREEGGGGGCWEKTIILNSRALCSFHFSSDKCFAIADKKKQKTKTKSSMNNSKSTKII